MSLDIQQQANTGSNERARRVRTRLLVIGAVVLCMGIGLALCIWPLSLYLQGSHYATGTCTVLTGQLTAVDAEGGDKAYKPLFTYRVHTADGKSYTAQGYGLVNSSSSEKQGEQAILDHFRVGRSYPCWYDPANPQQAVLTRSVDALTFLPGITFIFAGLFIIFLTRTVRRPANTALSNFD